ncbi:hypothetical protein V3C99_014611 [Haemonchus contortus]|uniref:Uncharacterized protein n=1 Tax=Haemonchus contortus TaxID=6289 RepID=A0A7I5EC84_HAECO
MIVNETVRRVNEKNLPVAPPNSGACLGHWGHAPELGGAPVVSNFVTNKQASKQTNKQTNKQTDRQTDRRTDRQTDRQTRALYI